MMRMKEYWFFQLCLFGEDGDEARIKKAASKIFRCKQVPDFEAAVREAAEGFPLRRDARYGWRKPL